MSLRSLRRNLFIARIFRRCPLSPFADTLAFLTRNEWPTYVFRLWLLGSLVIAVVNPKYDGDLYRYFKAS
jgi:hypothetical protein